jgi:hypothetical protein
MKQQTLQVLSCEVQIRKLSGHVAKLPACLRLAKNADRLSMAEFKECCLEWSWILIGASGGGGRDSESFQAS